MKKIIGILLLIVATNLFGFILPSFELPKGFSVQIYSENVPGARSLALGKNGTVFVGTKSQGKVYAISNLANNQRKVYTIASGLNQPNGVVFVNDALYVAAADKIIRFDNIESQLAKPPAPVLITDAFPKQYAHAWKYMRLGPDHKLYISVGAPCNVCLSSDPRFATIMRLNLDGSNLEIFAKGIRNSVGFDWDPETKELWFTNHGRDWMGDNMPPDNLDHAPKPGLNFGFPFYHGRIPDPKFSKQHPVYDFVAPSLDLPAHVAPLGMVFYTGKMFPAEYQNQIFIAEHGSWNRSTKVGYKISLVTKQGNKLTYKPFMTGFLKWQITLGRPVDFLILPDGSLLISDDYNGVIYRVIYQVKLKS